MNTVLVFFNPGIDTPIGINTVDFCHFDSRMVEDSQQKHAGSNRCPKMKERVLLIRNPFVFFLFVL